MSQDPAKRFRDLLAKITETSAAEVGSSSSGQDRLAKNEQRQYAKQKTDDDDPAIPARKAKSLRLLDLEDYYAQRKRYIPRLFYFIVSWVVVLLALILLSALEPPFSKIDEYQSHAFWIGSARFVNWVFDFQLSDTVLVAMLGGTTANILGLFLVVARYLYPSHKTPDPDNF